MMGGGARRPALITDCRDCPAKGGDCPKLCLFKHTGCTGLLLVPRQVVAPAASFATRGGAPILGGDAGACHPAPAPEGCDLSASGGNCPKAAGSLHQVIFVRHGTASCGRLTIRSSISVLTDVVVLKHVQTCCCICCKVLLFKQRCQIWF